MLLLLFGFLCWFRAKRAKQQLGTCCEVICNFIESETKRKEICPIYFYFHFLCFFIIIIRVFSLHIPRREYSSPEPGAAGSQTHAAAWCKWCVISRVTAPFIENALRIIYVYAERQAPPHTPPPLFIWTCCEDWRCDFDNNRTLFRCSFTSYFFSPSPLLPHPPPFTPTYQIMTCDSDVRTRHTLTHKYAGNDSQFKQKKKKKSKFTLRGARYASNIERYPAWKPGGYTENASEHLRSSIYFCRQPNRKHLIWHVTNEANCDAFRPKTLLSFYECNNNNNNKTNGFSFLNLHFSLFLFHLERTPPHTHT